MRRIYLIVGALVAVLGIGCLNFTTFDGVDHHRAWAQEHGLPQPSQQIFMLGVASAVAGAGLFGFGLGRLRPK